MPCQPVPVGFSASFRGGLVEGDEQTVKESGFLFAFSASFRGGLVEGARYRVHLAS